MLKAILPFRRKQMQGAVFSIGAASLLREYTPFSLLLAHRMMPNSIGTRITVPKMQNSRICGRVQKYPNNK